jgi:VWFA-related protein
MIAFSQNVFSAHAQTEPDQVIKVDTNLVSVFFTAVDQDNRFVTSFERADVTVYEDGVKQEILAFQRDTDRPLSLALLIDISGSEKLKLAEEKAAARGFVDAVIRNNSDQMAIVSFAADPFLEQPLTNGIEDARKAIERIEVVKGVRGYQGRGTVLPAGAKPASGFLSYTSAIWDALWITSRHLLSPLPVNSRRVIVIVTDGEDTSSRASLDEAIDIALHTDTVIYVIGVGDTSIAGGVNKGALGKLALRTGGRFFSPRKDEDLTAAFERIATELRSQYLLTYAPRNVNAEQAYRQVRIEIGDSQSRKYRPRLFYRPGYYFKKQTGTP